jgi:hypothetical protein
MQIAISICSSNLQKKYRDLSELYVRQLSMRSDRGSQYDDERALVREPAISRESHASSHAKLAAGFPQSVGYMS